MPIHFETALRSVECIVVVSASGEHSFESGLLRMFFRKRYREAKYGSTTSLEELTDALAECFSISIRYKETLQCVSGCIVMVRPIEKSQTKSIVRW